jgi:hypothetical protein
VRRVLRRDEREGLVGAGPERDGEARRGALHVRHRRRRVGLRLGLVQARQVHVESADVTLGEPRRRDPRHATRLRGDLGGDDLPALRRHQPREGAPHLAGHETLVIGAQRLRVLDVEARRHHAEAALAAHLELLPEAHRGVYVRLARNAVVRSRRRDDRVRGRTLACSRRPRAATRSARAAASSTFDCMARASAASSVSASASATRGPTSTAARMNVTAGRDT